MTQLASLSRLGLLSTFAVVLAAACGGQSFTSGGDGDAGSSSTAGKTGQGGSTSHAGKTSTAGTNQAGFGSTGTTGGTGSSGTTSTAGAGGAVLWNEACDAAPFSGNCDAYIEAWYHDPATGICMPFVYGGCGGNANRYGTLADCQKSCPGGNPNYDACKLPSDCLVTGPGCCGICDGPGISAHDLISYNRAYANQLQCGLAFGVAGDDAAGAAAPIACAPCVQVGGGTLQNFIPNCVQNECVVEDIRTSAVTACKTSADCKLRVGTSCCEGCGSGNLFAVRKDGSFEKLVCGGQPVACDACAPTPTPGAVAICGASGHCEVAYALDAAQ